jgi:hypothetical protein
MSSRTVKVAMVVLAGLWAAPSFANYLSGCNNATLAAVLPDGCKYVIQAEGVFGQSKPPQPFVDKNPREFSFEPGDSGAGAGPAPAPAAPSGGDVGGGGVFN